MRLPSQEEGATAFHPARRWAGGGAYGPMGPRGSTRVALESRGAHDGRSSPRWMTVPLAQIIAGDRRAGPSLAAVQANSRAALAADIEADSFRLLARNPPTDGRRSGW
jgi:hypothetical protein